MHLTAKRNAYAERWVQTVRQECLDHFVVFGEDHFRHLLSEFTDYYNRCRPHQGVGNRPVSGEPPAPAEPVGAITCAERLGGLLKHYARAA